MVLGKRCSESVCVSELPGASRTPRTEASAWGTSSGSDSGASSTNHTPSWYPSSTSEATVKASRVLPNPPGPVRVRSRCSESSASTLPTSCTRPIKLESCRGKLCSGRPPSGVPGNSTTDPGSPAVFLARRLCLVWHGLPSSAFFSAHSVIVAVGRIIGVRTQKAAGGHIRGPACSPELKSGRCRRGSQNRLSSLTRQAPSSRPTACRSRQITTTTLSFAVRLDSEGAMGVQVVPRLRGI